MFDMMVAISPHEATRNAGVYAKIPRILFHSIRATRWPTDILSIDSAARAKRHQYDFLGLIIRLIHQSVITDPIAPEACKGLDRVAVRCSWCVCELADRFEYPCTFVFVNACNGLYKLC
jgi:hypothetical protein